MQNIKLDEDLIDAEMENIQQITTDEEMLITSCYVAECLTFGKEPEFEKVDIEYWRNHMVDVILRLLNFR